MKRNILVLVLLVGLAVSAFGQYYNGPFEIEEKNGNLTIEGLREGFENITELEIPADIFGYPVVAISSGAFDDCKPTSITLPANINIQPDSFFYSLYDSYMKNGRRATTFAVAYSTFNDFEILIFNNISVEIIGYTGSVKAVRIPDRINNLPVVAIGDSAFSGNQLTSVVIPNSVTTIGNSAFSYNQLTSVTLPNSVTTIEGLAFYGNQLTSVNLPNSLTSIGNYAFMENKLTSIVIPNSVTEIGSSAFAGSIDGRDVGSGNVIRSVTFGNSVTTIGRGAFRYNQLTSVIIPNSVTEIGEDAFSRNPLVSVTIPESVRKIESGAFITRNANAGGTLTTIIIGSNVEIDRYGFDGYFHLAYRDTNRRAGRYVIVRNGGRTNSGQMVDTWERAGSQ